MSSCQRRQPPTTTSACGTRAETAFRLSYPLPVHWPYGPINLVMERNPGTCDLYRDHRFCCELSRDDEHSIERHVRDAIASVLVGCERRSCRAIDLGANNGWMTAYMLSLGAHTIAVEPQADFAAAIEATAHANCWSTRCEVLHAFACPEPRFDKRRDGTLRDCFRARDPRRSITFHRHGGGPPRDNSTDGNLTRGIALEDVLYRGVPDRSAPLHVDLIKLDGDGPEPFWMETIELMLRTRNLTVDAITVEHMPGFRSIRPRVVRAFVERHGFEVFRLDTDDCRRLMTSTGWDAYSPSGTIAQLGHVRGALPRDSFEEEMFSIRAMKRVFRIKDGLSLGQWSRVLSKLPHDHLRYPGQELLLVHRRVGIIERRVTDRPSYRLSIEARTANFTRAWV